VTSICPYAPSGAAHVRDGQVVDIEGYRRPYGTEWEAVGGAALDRRGRASLSELEGRRDQGVALRVRYRGVPDAGATAQLIEPLPADDGSAPRKAGARWKVRSNPRR
jgi:hypothetical protein